MNEMEREKTCLTDGWERRQAWMWAEPESILFYANLVYQDHDSLAGCCLVAQICVVYTKYCKQKKCCW